MLMTRRCLTARFGLLGALVGKFPWASAGLFLLVISTPALLGLWLGLRLEIGLDQGFVPWNAPSRREITAQKQFFGNTEQTKEWYMALFGIARPADGSGGRNMLMSENYDEFAAFYERITRRMVFQGPRGNFTYADICQPLCDINDSLQKLMEHSWLKYLGQVKMRYPVSRVLSYDVNIGKHVFNRTLDANGELVGAESVAFYFTAFIRDGMRAKELEQFELAVATEAAAHNLRPNSRVELIAHGSNSVRTEMSSGIMDAFRNRLLGLAFGLLAFLALHAAAGWLHSQFPWRRLLLAMLCVPFLPLAFFSSLSLLSLVGLSVNLLHFTSPLLAIGLLFVVHGGFQLADAWCRLLSESKRKQFTASERLASTFEQIAPAFLSSQLGPALAFGVLSPLLPALHYPSFCLALSLMHGFCFLLQVLFFAPLLARLCHHHSDHVRFVNGQPTVLEFGPNDPVMATKKPSIADHPPIIQLKAKNGHDLIPAATNGHLQMAKKREQRKAAKRQLRLAVSQKLIRPWSAFLRSLVGRILITFVTTILLWLALGQGMPALKNDMDYRRLLPEGSPAHRGFHLIDSIWMDFLQILYIVHKPPDFEQPEQFNEFKNFLVAATALPQALPPEAHMSWLVDYYRDRLHSELFDRLSPEYASEAVNMSHFGEFINGFPYRAWQSGVRFSFRPENNRSRPSIDQMLVIIAYNDTRGLAGKRRLINQCRQVAKQFAQFRVTVFDTDLRTTDIMDTVEPILWRTAAALVLSAFLVCLLFLWQFSAAFLAALTAASTLAMLFGLGQLLGLQLDLLTVSTAIVVASLSIQLGAQFLGHLLSCWAKEDPHWHAMALSVSALTKTLLVWLALCLLPLLLSRVPFFGLQARLLLLGALLALWHGLALVPMLAGLLPRGWLI